jgi:hypothetical protein
MKNWFRRIFKKNHPRQKQNDASKAKGMPEISPSQAQAMMEMIGKTQEVEIACDEAHRFLGEFAEMALRGEDTQSLMPLVHHHLEMCPDCREEYEALMQILKASP